MGTDTETTGVNRYVDRIVQFALVIDGTKNADTVFETLVNPGVPIPAGASEVHGITDEMVQAEGMDPEDAMRQLLQALGTAERAGMPVVVFNAPFDLTLIREEAVRYRLCTREGFPRPLVYDPFVVDKQIDPYRKGKRTLTAMAAHYGIPFDESTAHGARADTQITIAIARAQLAKVSPRATFESLHADQQVWKASQMANFRQYLAKNGKPTDDAKGDWPIETYKSEEHEPLTESAGSVAG